MTREEAIYLLNNLRSVAEGKEDEAIDMAIEALQREDDLLKSFETNEPIYDMVEVVRCKNCIHYRKVTKNYGICYERPNVITSQKADDFCSYGERKGGKE